MLNNCQICNNKQFTKIGNKDEYSIFQCNSCDLYQLDPLPSLEVRTKFYNGNSNIDYYQSRLNHKFKRAKSKIKSLQKYIKSNGKQFLDIGCSIGSYVGAAKDLGFTAHGIDLSNEAVKQAQINFPNAQFYTQSIEQRLAESDVKYDLINCRDVIEHVTDLNEFVKPVSELLNPGGVLYVTTPDAGHIRVPKNFESWKHVHTPDHVFYFNKKNLVTLLGKYQITNLKTSFSTRTTIELIGQKQ